MLVRGSFEDLIYIVIGVIWIAFSIYKGMQKKKAQKQQPHDDEHEYEPEPVKKKTAFESFIDEILVEEEPTPYKPVSYDSEPEPVEEPVKEEEKVFSYENFQDRKVFSYDDYYEESNYQKDLSVYEKADTQSKELNQQLKTSRKKRRKPHFNLRKAVIYSEILNSRYF